jgi:deaminated glutathione amidase
VAVHVGIHVPVAVKLPDQPTSNPVLTAIPQGSFTAPTTNTNSGSSGSISNISNSNSSSNATPVPSSSNEGDSRATTKLYNRSILIQADGSIDEPASYDKLHLFDYGALRESNACQAGTVFTPPFASPVGRLGSLICFDLRFPEAALHLAQPPATSAFAATPAQVLLYPSAFTVPTGRAHWEVLLRSRAIETQSWVVASAQVGRHGEGAKRVSYGRSMVVDPWGKVVLELKGVEGETDGEWEAEEGAIGEIGFVDIDLDQVDQVRERMPLIRRT